MAGISGESPMTPTSPLFCVGFQQSTALIFLGGGLLASSHSLSDEGDGCCVWGLVLYNKLGLL